ncbi:MAG: hypothetical protein JST93_08560 [Acidobacteria bacterium]|nr:hypothetical protein [Acidobacteriota bacterium]
MYYRRMRIAPRLPSSLLATAFLFAAFYALRFAYADFLFQSGTPENIRKAAAIVPSNPTYAYRSGNLKRAVQLNPYLSPAWIDLALAAEAANNPAEAEKLFLQAAKVDQTFPPRWALANFYFRRQQGEPFWRWLRLAAERSYGDRTALFRLAWHFTQDSKTILDRAILPTPEFLGLYLEYLRTQAQWDAAVEAASRLAPIARPAEKTQLLELSDALLKANQTASAIRVWSFWEPARPIIPTLDTEPVGKGFAWRLPWREGVSHQWSAPAQHIRITLDGRQAERTELLELFTPVRPGATYRLESHHRLDRITPNSGIRWIFACPPRDPFFEALIGRDAAESTITVPAACDLLQITLLYQRASGTVRQEGDFFLVAPFYFLPAR